MAHNNVKGIDYYKYLEEVKLWKLKLKSKKRM